MSTHPPSPGRLGLSLEHDCELINEIDMKTDYNHFVDYVHDHYYDLCFAPSKVLETLAEKLISHFHPYESPKSASLEEMCSALFASRISGMHSVTLSDGLVATMANRIFNDLNYELPGNLVMEMLTQKSDGSTGLVERKKSPLKLNYSGPFQQDSDIITIPKNQIKLLNETINPFRSLTNIDKITRFGSMFKIADEEASQSNGYFDSTVKSVIGRPIMFHDHILQDLEPRLMESERSIVFHNSDAPLGVGSGSRWNMPNQQLCVRVSEFEEELEEGEFGEEPEKKETGEREHYSNESLAGSIMNELNAMHCDSEDEWYTPEELLKSLYLSPHEPLAIDPLIGPGKPSDLEGLTPESRQALARAMRKHDKFATFNMGYVEYLEKDPAMKLLDLAQRRQDKQESHWYTVASDKRWRDEHTLFMKHLKTGLLDKADKNEAAKERISWMQSLMEAEITADKLWDDEFQRNMDDVHAYIWSKKAEAIGCSTAVPPAPQIALMPRDNQYRFLKNPMDVHAYMAHDDEQQQQQHKVQLSNEYLKAHLHPFYEVKRPSIRRERIRMYEKKKAKKAKCREQDASGDANESDEEH